MSDNTTIEWTDATWNPITGCSVVSAGCKHCYAMKLAGTRLRNHPSREGLTVDTGAGPVWNGQVRFNEQWIDQPLRWKRPRRVFVCAHSDLFHQNVDNEWLDRVFEVMARAPQHTFQVLTKRPARMAAYVNSRHAEMNVRDAVKYDDHAPSLQWPLSNVWLGVSVEDQETSDDRIPLLLQTPAATRFLSLEPLIARVDLDYTRANFADGLPWIDWAIVGGESGAGARPMHPDWARELRDHCKAHKVPFFFKQWGEFHPATDHDLDEMGCLSDPIVIHTSGAREYRPLEAFMLTGPGAQPGWVGMCKLGKKRAGRMLDGREHNAFPPIRIAK
jgi:protein gp37